MNIAKRKPFEGKPIITSPSVLGCSPDKPYFYRLSAIGTRPITFSVTGLPAGLILDGQIISGTASVSGCFFIRIKAKNCEGCTEKTVRLEIFRRNNQRTPLMGFTTWNAFSTYVTQENMLETAADMTRLGLIDYGYHYINLDSSWQGEYGGPFDAIQPCERFPDMKSMVKSLHESGYKVGIYSSPFLEPWGCPIERKALCGCTLGPADFRFPLINAGIGSIRKEKNNVAQWADWGIDYLKYDWTPTDTTNADIMRQALDDSPRDFVYCVTVNASPQYAEYWKRNLNSWRFCTDTNGTWEIEKRIYNTYPQWQEHTGNGHYCDLDMLSIGKMGLFNCAFTDEEKLFEYSARAFLTSPIQLSCLLNEATDFELDLYSNEEIIAINQDGLLAAAKVVYDENDLRIFEKPLENGDLGIGVFNASDEEQKITYSLPAKAFLRDLWRKLDIGCADKLTVTLPPHSAEIFRASCFNEILHPDFHSASHLS